MTPGRTKNPESVVEDLPNSKPLFWGSGGPKIPVGSKLTEESSNVTVTEVARSRPALAAVAGRRLLESLSGVSVVVASVELASVRATEAFVSECGAVVLHSGTSFPELDDLQNHT